MNTVRVDIDLILSEFAENPNISDLHLTCSGRSSYRLNWDIVKDEKIPLINSENMEIILKQLFQNNAQNFDKFICDKESDFAYEGKDWTSYRVNAFFEKGKIWIVMRKINSHIPIWLIVLKKMYLLLKRDYFLLQEQQEVENQHH